MSETVGTYLFFTEQPETPLGDLVEVLTASGWALSKRGGQYRYWVDYDQRTADSVAEVRSNVDAGTSGWIQLEQEALEINVVRNSEGVPPSEIPSVRLWTWGHEFRHRGREKSPSMAAKNVEAYLSAVESALELLNPAYAYGEYTDPMPSELVPTADDLLKGRFHYVFWLNAFGPSYVEAIGRERLESAPGWRVEELDDDLFLVVTADNPVDVSDEWVDTDRAVANHLGVSHS